MHACVRVRARAFHGVDDLNARFESTWRKLPLLLSSRQSERASEWICCLSTATAAAAAVGRTVKENSDWPGENTRQLAGSLPGECSPLSPSEGGLWGIAERPSREPRE